MKKVLKNFYVFFILFLVCCTTNPQFPKNTRHAKAPIPKKGEIYSQDLIDLSIKFETVSEYNFSKVNAYPLPKEFRVYAVNFSKDQKTLVLVSSFRISQFSLPEMEEIRYIEPRKIVEGGFTGLSFSEDGNEILAGSSWENKAYLLDWKGNKKKSFSCKYPYAYTEDVSFSRDGSEIIMTCYQFAKEKRYLGVYNKDGREISFLPANNSYIDYFDSKLITYSHKELSFLKNFQNHITIKFPTQVQYVTIHKEKELITLNENRWTIWTISGVQLIQKNSFQAKESEFKNEDYQIDTDYKSYGALSPDGRFLLTGGVQGAYIWNRRGSLKKHLDGHKRNVSAVAYSRDGKMIATVSPDKLILWENKSTD